MKYFKVFLFAVILFTACSDDREQLVQPSLQNDLIDSTGIMLSRFSETVAVAPDSFGQLIVKVSPDILKKHNDVLFQVFPIGTFNNDSTTLKITLDITGEARAFVKSATPGVSYIRATVGNASRTTSVTFKKPEFDTLKLFVQTDNIPADNISYAEIYTVTKNLDPANRSIIFTTDKGVFSNGEATYTIQAGANDTTRAFIRYNRADRIRIVATASAKYSKEIFLNFSTAYPNNSRLETDSAILTATLTAFTPVSVQLTRDPGTVSPGQVIHFYDSVAVAGARQSAGSFFNVTASDDSGKASAQYRIQRTDYTGLLYIKCYVETPAGRVYGENTVVVQ